MRDEFSEYLKALAESIGVEDLDVSECENPKLAMACRIQLKIGELQDQIKDLEVCRFSPIGDNHHNAAKCPYCRAGMIGLVIGMFNEALANDYDAITKLIRSRVSCNQTLADHPTIQVGKDISGDNAFDVGPLGLVNGVLGVLGLPLIAYQYDTSTEKVITFQWFPGSDPGAPAPEK